jgi:DnaJ-domain-containing protein 1
MQITLSAQQSKILELLSQQGGYASLEDAIDTALVLLADEVSQQDPDTNPDYLAWVEQTRLKLDAGIRAAEQGNVLGADDVLTRLRQKVSSAKATSA